MTLTDWLGCWLPKMLIIRFWENWESRRFDISSKAAPIDRYPDIRSKIVWSVVSTQANQKSWSDKHAWQQINRQHSRSSHAVSITSLWKIQSKLSKDLYHPYDHIGEASFVCVESGKCMHSMLTPSPTEWTEWQVIKRISLVSRRPFNLIPKPRLRQRRSKLVTFVHHITKKFYPFITLI